MSNGLICVGVILTGCYFLLVVAFLVPEILAYNPHAGAVREAILATKPL